MNPYSDLPLVISECFEDCVYFYRMRFWSRMSGFLVISDDYEDRAICAVDRLRKLLRGVTR